MKKNLLLSLALMAALSGVYNAVYAEAAAEQPEKPAVPVQQAEVAKTDEALPPPSPNGEFQKPPFGEPCNLKGDKNFPPKFEGPHPSKAEMDAKKAEIDKRLNLTSEQKKKIENFKAKDRKKIKPIMDKLKANHEEMRKLKFDPTISKKDKDKEIKKLEKERESLKDKADKCRKDNMEKFESVLTKEQKKEFENIKEEQRKHMEERRHPDRKKQEFEQVKKFDQQDERPPFSPGMIMH